MGAEEAEKSAPGSNATGRDAKVQATVEEKADVPTQDSQDPTKAAEEMAETGGQRNCQETIEEDMSDSGEIGTSEASAEDTAATAGRGKRPRAESTERNMKRPECQWHRVTGAMGKKYSPETRSVSSPLDRGQGRDK
ncbi:hypothetical protein MTO96_048924 [Rhipicephalus appendiculatus]